MIVECYSRMWYRAYENSKYYEYFKKEKCFAQNMFALPLNEAFASASIDIPTATVILI